LLLLCFDGIVIVAINLSIKFFEASVASFYCCFLSLINWRDLNRLIVSFSTMVSELELELCRWLFHGPKIDVVVAILMTIGRRLLVNFHFIGRFSGCQCSN